MVEKKGSILFLNIVLSTLLLQINKISYILTSISITLKGVTMRITSKGQVTIPQELRNQFGLFPDTEVAFHIVSGMIVLQKVSGHKRGEDLIRRMSGKATVKMSTDEIMDLTRTNDSN